VGLGFGGEVAEFYARFRRGYPAAVLDAVVAAFGLAADDVVVDLGCGTGQLALPLAGRVRAVVGMDPESDMLVLARRAADAGGVTNISWVLGADTDVPGLGVLLGERSVAAVTIGTALHWMHPEDLFRALVPLLRPGGGVAAIANGVPLWAQDSEWSQRLRGFLEQWLGHPARSSCGTDTESRRGYRDALAAGGFTDVQETMVEYTDELDLDQLVGALYSAMPADRLPAPADRPAFADGVRHSLHPYQRFTDHVRVSTLLGRIR
jgi:ubiquinone/menaquinone biosynthesis C-methylase UbiE